MAFVSVLITAVNRVPGASSAIIAMLSRDYPEKYDFYLTRRVGYVALSRIRDAATADYLLRCVEDRGHEFRLLALKALGEVGSSAAVPVLVSISKNDAEDRNTRTIAASSAASLGDSEARLMMKDPKKFGLDEWTAKRVGQNLSLFEQP